MKARALFWPCAIGLAVLLAPDTSIADEAQEVLIVTPKERAAIVRELQRRADMIDEQSEEIERLQKALRDALMRSTCT